MKNTISMLFALIFSIHFLGCTQPDSISSDENPDVNFTIEFQSSNSRLIQVEELPVTKLHLEISGTESKSFDWYPGCETTLSMELSMGSYELSVIHYAMRNDELIEFSESSSFEIKPNYITLITIIPGAIGQANVEDNPIDNSGAVIELTDLELVQKNIIGCWEGTVTTPWVAPYSVDIEFKEDGTYSARNTSSSGPAFYYGTDADSDVKTFEIYDLYANGDAVGKITVLFDVGTTNVSKLDYIRFSDDSNALSFEYWHRSEYGPVKFDLTRK